MLSCVVLGDLTLCPAEAQRTATTCPCLGNLQWKDPPCPQGEGAAALDAWSCKIFACRPKFCKFWGCGWDTALHALCTQCGCHAVQVQRGAAQLVGEIAQANGSGVLKKAILQMR